MNRVVRLELNRSQCEVRKLNVKFLLSYIYKGLTDFDGGKVGF